MVDPPPPQLCTNGIPHMKKIDYYEPYITVDRADYFKINIEISASRILTARVLDARNAF